MTIEALKSVVPPPKSPIGSLPERTWEVVQKEMGTALPDDLRQIGLAYGSGQFLEGEMVVHNPFDADYPAAIKMGCRMLQQLKDGEGSDYIPYQIHPNQPGLLRWGADSASRNFFWLTEGPPDQWPIILRWRDNVYERYDMSLTEFLVKSFKHELKWLQDDPPLTVDFRQ